MDSVLFWLIKGPLYLISLLPLRILFIFSDMFYFLVYYIVGYRKKVVENNLKESFPDKSPAELKKIEKGFYHHFCDYIFETIKLLHVSDKEMVIFQFLWLRHLMFLIRFWLRSLFSYFCFLRFFRA